ncbi:hypothetical protein L917_14701 [Phytophthora nicotianae]|nr:hypothetical protein L916_14890 [Phytophthora nicotianae]ETL85813.1 hypothetical protein L917_14701 [Phytophthora nicotianae]
MIEVKEEETQVDLLVVVSLVVMNLVAVIPGGESTGGGAVGRNAPTIAAKQRSRASRDTAPVEIKLNDRVVPVGRPGLNRKEARGKAKSDLKEYNQGMKLHGLLRERNVCEVVASLKEIQPGLREVGSFLATFQVLGIAVGKPLLWAMSPSYVPDNVRYRPPEPTVDRALEQVRETLCGEQAEIQIDSDGESGDSDNYVVAIETIGTYTIDQLDAMTWLWNFAGHVSSRCCVVHLANQRCESNC